MKSKRPRSAEILAGRDLTPYSSRKELINMILKFGVLLSALLSLTSCAGLSVRGSVGGQTIDTRVDSEVARYYLGNYLAGKRSDALLDERIDRVYQSADGHLPDRDDLKKLSDDFSVDFAALYFADRITRVPVNRRFRSDFDQAYEYTLKGLRQGRVEIPATAKYDVLFVPTYLYKRLTFTGADMAVPREALQKVGFTCYFVETQDDGAIEANADLVIAAIRAHAQSGRRLIIVSASKSGPEVALALTKMEQGETSHVAAWINTVGALQGTPLVDERLLPEIEFIVGQVDVAGRDSLTVVRSRQRFSSFRIPEHVLVVNYFGIPTIGSISFMAQLGFFPLRKHGPNDGLILLPDMVFPGGVTLVQLGSDHIQLNHRLDIAAVALAITVTRWLENPEHQRPPLPAASTG